MDQMKSRVFLVGCPRSGTTLLQSLLAAHPQIASVPETHFFKHLSFKSKFWNETLGRLEFISRRGRGRLKSLLRNIGQENRKQYLPRFGLFNLQYVRAFTQILDDFTKEQGKSIWIEKTPGHLRYIDYITKVIPDAKFIHIIRQGEDVVASLYEATNQYPEQWGRALDIDECITSWNSSIQISQRYSHQPNHILVVYENLVNNPQAILEKLCDFLGVEFDQSMMQNRKSAAKSIVLDSEPWKSTVYQSISKDNSNKFFKLFDDGEREYIRSRLLEIHHS
ncbi:sulfotransferase [filamentous cyanobacterium CCP2]|nr:sulfotransferase [filamentous cyanobacterium CCP2]